MGVFGEIFAHFKLLHYEALFFAIFVEVKSESKSFVYLYIMTSYMTSAMD